MEVIVQLLHVHVHVNVEANVIKYYAFIKKNSQKYLIVIITLFQWPMWVLA